MEEIEGSETVEENGFVAELGLMENPNDKNVEEVTRVYGSGPDSKETVCFSSSLAGKYDNEFDSERIGIRDSIREIFGEFDSIAEEVQVKGVENAPHSKISDGKVSESGTSLFGEVSGPQNGFVKRNEVVLGEDIEKREYCNKDLVGENGGSFYGNVESSIVEVLAKEEEVTLCDGHKFLVGDLVWVSTKAKSWWPGLIIDPSHVCNVDQNAPLLVKYFGNNPTVWCSPIQLKPFVENFEHMSSQGKSRVFLSAVEKAKDEFGRRIKAQVTCSCGNGDIKDEIVFLDKNVLSQFEPVNFLYLVKNLAWDDTKTGVLDLVKIRSYLSSFYRSLGHHQKPVNQLQEETDGNKHSAKKGKNSKLSAKRGKNLKLNDVIADKDLDISKRDTYPLQFSEDKSKIQFKSRERRKSKYLSYPYIGATNDMAVSNSVADYSVSPPTFKSTAKKLCRKSPLIQMYQSKASIVLGDLNTPSRDLLSKLRFAAVDCVFPMEGSGFDSVDRVFYGFRKWVFHDKYDPEMEHKKLSVENSKDEFKYQRPVGDKPLTSNSNPVITPKRKRRKKNETSSTNLNAKSAPSSDYFDGNNTSGSPFLNFEAAGSFRLQNLSEPEKMPAEISMAVFPDLDKQSAFVENSQAKYITTPVSRLLQNKKKKKARPFLDGSSVKNVELMGNGEGINNEATGDLSNSDGNKSNGSSMVKSPWVMGLLAPGDNNKPEATNRKRKEKIVKTETQASIIPDLNGNANIKSPKKRRRNKNISPPTDLNPCFTKVHMNRELSGTALVLTFAQGFPVPSKEALVATFCGFGPLNETETKGLSDNRSAQVVFKNGLEAVEALKGIEKSSPFGPVLVKCQLRHIGLKSCEKKANKPKEAPNLAFIKKNLEMMTSTLATGGDNLSAEMRAKLENEIKRLLKKVTMVGSTSSS